MPVIRQPNKKQDTTTQQTTHTEKLKTYDRTPIIQYKCNIEQINITINITALSSYLKCQVLL